MKFNKIFSVLFASTLFFSGCVEEVSTESFENIKLDKTYLTIPEDGGSVELTINATEAWKFVITDKWPETVTFAKDEEGKTYKAKYDEWGNLINPEEEIASKTPTWLSASTLEGAEGTTTVTFTAEASNSGREFELAIVCNRSKQHIMVRQGSMTAVDATCKDVIDGPDGKTYRVKGTCTSIANDVYGNWYLNDGTGEVYVYGTLNNGEEKKFAELGIEVGDVVYVEGPKTTYNSTIELVNVTVLSIEKSLLKIVTESATYSKDGDEFVVKAAFKGEGVNYSVPAEYQDWVIVTGLKTEKGTPSKLEPNPADTAYVSVKLLPNTASSRKGAIELSSASGKNSSELTYEFTQDGSIIDATVAEFLAAEPGVSYYRLTGKICNIKSDVYGNFDIVDGTDTAYVYGLTATQVEKNDKSFASLGLREGDIVTIVGTRAEHNGDAQVGGPAYLEKSWKSEDVTVSEFLAKEVASKYLESPYYRITGVVKEIKSGDYGNLYLQEKDSDTYVYMYGCTVAPVAKNDKSFNKLGIEAGDEITVIGQRGRFDSAKVEDQKDQIANGYIFSVTKGSSGVDPDEPENPGTGDASVVYTLDTTNAEVKGSNNSYAGNCDVEVGGITWNITGNSTMNPWRVGGKSLESVDREVYTKTAYSSALTKVVLTLGTNSTTLNSCKLIYSTNADFSDAKELSFDYKEGAIELVADFPANAYYKFVFNITVTETSNKFLQFSKVEFYGAK